MPGFIPESTLAEIKARIDLPDLVRSYGIDLRRAGADFKACCPFHHEKTPSFIIHPNQGYYHCFGCGEKGNAFTFLMKREGLGFVEAVKRLARQCGVAIEEEEDPLAGMRNRLYKLHAELAEFFHRCLKVAKEAEAARAYLVRRKLTDEVVERFCIGYAPVSYEALEKWARKYGFTADEMDAAGVLLKSKHANGRPYNRFAGRLMFTIRDRAGRPVAFSGRILTNDKKVAKYVNSPETPVFKKSNILFAFDQAAANIVKAPHREAIVCEGQLVFDADGAGQKAAIRTGGEFLAAQIPVRVATLPDGEDPDSLLRDKGPAAFRACLENAESITQFQVRTLRAKEERPDTIDAVTRVSRAVLETLAQCPSAIMRASLVAEAAELLKVPVSALEEDLAHVKAKAASGAWHAPSPAPAAPKPSPAPVPVAKVPDPASFDAAAPVNNPPSTLEMALCEFLFEHEGDRAIAGSVNAFLPDVVLNHVFTRQFVAAWRLGLSGSADAFAEMRLTLDPVSCAWLDRILLGHEGSGLSEMSAEKILEMLLRKIWIAAVHRRQGELPAQSSPENDTRRLRLSQLARTIQRAPWDRLVELMDSKTLD